MYAVEFNATVQDGKIEIPMNYKHQFSSEVKVILMKKEAEKASKIKAATTADKGFGALAHLANPSLWEQEAGAWERAAVKKHDPN